jgi:hypothetical protein
MKEVRRTLMAGSRWFGSDRVLCPPRGICTMSDCIAIAYQAVIGQVLLLSKLLDLNEFDSSLPQERWRIPRVITCGIASDTSFPTAVAFPAHHECISCRLV